MEYLTRNEKTMDKIVITLATVLIIAAIYTSI